MIVGLYAWNAGVIEYEDQPEHSIQRIATGRYRITLKTPFTGNPFPVCVITGIGSNPFVFSVSATTIGNNVITDVGGAGYAAFDVHAKYWSTGGWLSVDAPFNFIIIGN
jgi:hypothetical protein